jgi:hypothetical protein
MGGCVVDTLSKGCMTIDGVRTASFEMWKSTTAGVSTIANAQRDWNNVSSGHYYAWGDDQGQALGDAALALAGLKVPLGSIFSKFSKFLPAGERIAETNLFRTVGQAEMDDIASLGAFRTPISNGKYFFPTLKQAADLGRRFEALGWGDQFIVQGSIPSKLLGSTLVESIAPATEGAALWIAKELLPSIRVVGIQARPK